MQANGHGRRFAMAGSAAIRSEAAEGCEVSARRRDILDRWHLARSAGLAADKAAKVVGVPRSTLFNWVRLRRQGRLEPRSRRPRRRGKRVQTNRRKPLQTLCSLPNATSETIAGPTSSIEGPVASQPPNQKMQHTLIFGRLIFPATDLARGRWQGGTPVECALPRFPAGGHRLSSSSRTVECGRTEPRTRRMRTKHKKESWICLSRAGNLSKHFSSCGPPRPMAALRDRSAEFRIRLAPPMRYNFRRESAPSIVPNSPLDMRSSNILSEHVWNLDYIWFNMLIMW